MGRGLFTERVNAGKKKARSRLSGDGARKQSNDKGLLVDLTNDAGSEVSIDEKLSHLSREHSVTFSDLDLSSALSRSEANSPSSRTGNSNHRNSVLLERERTINALLHRIEEMQNTIDTLQSDQDKLRKENDDLRKSADSKVNSIQTDRGNEDKATPNDQNLKAKHNQDSVHNLEVSPSSKSGLEVEKNLEQKKDSWMPQILGLTALGLAGALTAWSQYIRQKT